MKNHFTSKFLFADVMVVGTQVWSRKKCTRCQYVTIVGAGGVFSSLLSTNHIFFLFLFLVYIDEAILDIKVPFLMSSWWLESRHRLSIMPWLEHRFDWDARQSPTRFLVICKRWMVPSPPAFDEYTSWECWCHRPSELVLQHLWKIMY